MSFLVLVVDDEPDVEMLFRQVLLALALGRRVSRKSACKIGHHSVASADSSLLANWI
jgi:CheY-like chemotaxis protein